MRHLAHILLCTGRMQGGARSNLIFSGYSVKAAQNEGFLKSRLSPICEVRWGVTEAGRPFQQYEGLDRGKDSQPLTWKLLSLTTIFYSKHHAAERWDSEFG